MHSLDPVFIQRLDYHTYAVLRGDRVTGLRQPVQPLDDKAADRVIIFRFQIQVQPVI